MEGHYIMIVCDIGNTTVHCYEDGKIWSLSHTAFKEFSTSKKVYYISVNEAMSLYIKKYQPHYIDLEPYFKFDTIYQGLGIDRIAACMSISDGIVIDAGSAITVDIMSGNTHLGGFILPGLMAYAHAYGSISPRLNTPMNPRVDLDALPQKTSDAISYGTIKPIILVLQSICKDKKMFFTGGDGKFFSQYFTQAIFDQALIFRGMLKVIKKLRQEEL